MTRLNGFLNRIGAAEPDQCACGHARETVEHFSAAMREMDSAERRHAAMNDDKTREPFVLPRRKSAVRPKALVTRHKSSSRYDQVCDGNGTTGPE